MSNSRYDEVVCLFWQQMCEYEILNFYIFAAVYCSLILYENGNIIQSIMQYD